MSDIKFRAYCNTNKKVFENVVIDFNNNICHIMDETFKGSPTIINDFTPIMFSGLQDKNGKDIYDGDILTSSTGEISEVHREKSCFFVRFYINGDIESIAMYMLKPGNIPIITGSAFN